MYIIVDNNNKYNTKNKISNGGVFRYRFHNNYNNYNQYLYLYRYTYIMLILVSGSLTQLPSPTPATPLRGATHSLNTYVIKDILIFYSVVIVRHHCVTHTKHKTFSHDITVYIYFYLYTNHYYIPINTDIISPDSQLPGKY